MVSNVPLNVVGLLSGGKDSCYNLCHCAKQGHKIVALATLAPPQGKDELDSYMYQTVGHDAVHLIAKAMDIPLYRSTLQGTAINQTSSYGSRLPTTNQSHEHDDETEDLFRLLVQVKSKHPEVNAVSVGAILSNYQRVRVEHVALRLELQLTPLSFLWQRNQSELLDEMCYAGMNSILVKVAGIELVKEDLGKNLLTMRPKLRKLHKMYGAHICGEGGEYETLTLDCPLFKRRIILDQTEIVTHSDSSFASVYYMTIGSAHLEEKASSDTSLQQVIVPNELDRMSLQTLKIASQYTTESIMDIPDAVYSQAPSRTPSCVKKNSWLAVGNISAAASPTVEDGFRSAFRALERILVEHDLDMAHLAHINVYLADQVHFPTLNNVYKTLFGVDPPSRACVAASLGTHECILIDAVAFDDGVRYTNQVALSSMPQNHTRRALHVQGLSYWASANIGPYSQAVDVCGRITMAGQIGLQPPTLMLQPSPKEQVVLALQHARRIFKAFLESRAERRQGWVEGCVCWLSDTRWIDMIRSVWQAQSPNEQYDEESLEGDWEEEWLGTGLHVDQVPTTYIVLSPHSLPRSALVEWQLCAHSGDVCHDDEDEHDSMAPWQAEKGEAKAGAGIAKWQQISSEQGRSRFGIAHIRHGSPSTPKSPMLSSHLSASNLLNVRVFFCDEESRKTSQSLMESLHRHCSVTYIPIIACLDRKLERADAVIVWQALS